jgi:hypothetical protein
MAEKSKAPALRVVGDSNDFTLAYGRIKDRFGRIRLFDLLIFKSSL